MRESIETTQVWDLVSKLISAGKDFSCNTLYQVSDRSLHEAIADLASPCILRARKLNLIVHNGKYERTINAKHANAVKVWEVVKKA